MICGTGMPLADRDRVYVVMSSSTPLVCPPSGRGTADLSAVPEDLRHHDLWLELLTDPVQGVHDSSGDGLSSSHLFAGMAAEFERGCIREKSPDGQAAARERGHRASPRWPGRPFDRMPPPFYSRCIRRQHPF
ncbi:hypothetical protein AQJ46_01340 [Streptomyces canus]|uniref:Uncharacterized protein n=1 Tax=Streptomyces canus TaxID=58343 RepID=A0A101SIF7_9ACTN|nr:hypothetical protein AQJ46_01340 [Streptomyces canus]